MAGTVALILLVLAAAGAVRLLLSPFPLGPMPERLLGPGFFDRPRPPGGMTLLADGAAAFDRMTAAIDGAAHSVFLQTFIFRNDTAGTLVADALVRAAGRGIDATLRRDVAGTAFELGDLLHGRISPSWRPSFRRSVRTVTDPFRHVDHSKYLVADEARVLFGGMNLGDEYRERWHDLLVEVDDPALAAPMAATLLRGEPWPKEGPAVLAVNRPGRCEIARGYLDLIGAARERIELAHAYVSDPAILDALTAAAGRGVAVDLILPESPDTHRYANRRTASRLTGSPGVTVRPLPEMLHAKAMLVDGRYAVVGSANLTDRSMHRNGELALFLHAAPGDPFVAALAASLAAMRERAPVRLDPYPGGIGERVAAIFGACVW